MEGVNEILTWINGWRSFLTDGFQGQKPDIEEVFWLMFRLLKEEAATMKKKLEEAGGAVEVK